MWIISTAIISFCVYNFRYIKRLYTSNNNTRWVMLNDTKDHILFSLFKIYFKTKTRLGAMYIKGLFVFNNNNSTIINSNILRINFLLDNELYTVDVPINRKLLSKKYNLSVANDTNAIEFNNRYGMIPLLVNPEKYGKGYDYMCQENDIIMKELPKEILAYKI